jgi:hypothetical protein
MKNWGTCVMKAFMWGIGLAALFFGVYYLFKDTSGYQSVQAVITSSSKGTTDDLGNWSYNVDYAYEVGGVRYTGSFSGSEGDAVGDTLTVYYDPEDPGTTFTSKGESTFLGVIGVLFGLFCLGSMGWGWLKSRRLPPSAPPSTNTEPGSGK